MGRDSGSFARKKAKYKQIPTVLVVCEDTKSNKKYIEDAALYYRANVDVLVQHCGNTDPLGIVEYAISESRKYDVVFCAIDRDSNHNFDAAIHKAKTNPKINIIDSHPCFEFWYLLHFGYKDKPYARAGKKSPADLLIKDLMSIKFFADYDKGKSTSLFESLLGEPFETALNVSPKVLANARETGNLNPSTKVHELINHIRSIKSLKPAE